MCKNLLALPICSSAQHQTEHLACVGTVRVHTKTPQYAYIHTASWIEPVCLRSIQGAAFSGLLGQEGVAPTARSQDIFRAIGGGAGCAVDAPDAVKSAADTSCRQGTDDLAQQVDPEDFPGAQENQRCSHQAGWVQAGASVLPTCVCNLYKKPTMSKNDVNTTNRYGR